MWLLKLFRLRWGNALLQGIGNSRVVPAPETNPLIERVKALYPTRDATEVEAIAWRISTHEALLDLMATEEEHAQLFKELDDWVFSLDFRQVKGMNVRSIQDARSAISQNKRLVAACGQTSGKAL